MHAVREEARGRRHLLGVPPLRRQAQAVRRMRAGAGTREVRRAAEALVVRLALVWPTLLSATACGAASMCRVRNRWGEPVFLFIACLLQHARDRYYIAGDDDSWLDIKYWVCAYANNQHAYGPLASNSPCLR